ncbi:MAG: tRNA (N(6)-L-threonylcarbamoyladenosine(37)-C(2))-methylthiotransferase [Ignisphaera sp.]|uniref:tRNA-t(6)A37 methylthiotransferase n=1 Tax=Ignisphaera aggregans TaxID=334771 RepID=A0A7J3MX77_9CREN
MVKIYVETYGCAVNKADSLIMKTILIEKGYEIVDTPEEADILIVNTCVVRYDTEVKMFKRIDQLLKLGKKLIVAGCITKVYPYRIRSLGQSISFIAPQSINRVIEAIESQQPVSLFDEYKSFQVLPDIVEGIKATIPVAEGCLDECSFCVVKIARPHLRSAPIEKVVSAFKKALEKGAIEIEITAQDLAVYGYDIYSRYALPDLLNELLNIDSREYVIRLGQMNPRHIVNFLDDLIAIIKNPKVYKHLHIPVQSGSNKILRYMNRKHNIELFLEVVKELKKKIEGIQIATDIIVGHPGEDEEAFTESIKLIVENYIDRVHIARFSPRPQTLSALMPQIPDPIKKSRSSYLEKIYEAIALDVNKEYVGSMAKIWITEIDTNRGKAIGRLYNYKPVVLDVGVEALGKRAYAEIVDATFYDLRGKVVGYI